MPMFSQPQSGQQNPFEEQQKVLNEIVRRVNDIDRRVRLNEQATLNQKQTIDNMNENFVKLRDEILERIRVVEAKAGIERLEMVEKSLKEMKEKSEGIPTRAELAKLRNLLSAASPNKESELDDALLAIEMLVGSKKEIANEAKK